MSETYVLKETITEERLVSPDEQNRSTMESLIVVFIVFLLILIVANNPNASYFSLTLPSWAPTLFTWAVLFVLILFFAGYAAGKIKTEAGEEYGGAFRLGFWAILILVLISVFLIFRQNNYRAAFWLALIAFILVLIVIFSFWNKSRGGAAWMIPLALGLVFYMAEVWNIVSLNNL